VYFLRACPTSGSLLVDHRATSDGVYETGGGPIINAHADLRAALDLLIKAASGLDGLPRPERQHQGDPEAPQKPS
jgi:hypothetical protein